MKRSFLLIALDLVLGIVLSFQLNAQPPEWLWAHSGGSNSYDYGTSAGVDLAGNTYVTGYFAGTMVFDNNQTITSEGSADFFIAKYDPNGNLTWVQRFGSDDGEFTSGISVESDGDFTICGYYKSDSFNIGFETLTNAGNNSMDVFVARFDRDGINMWAKSMGGPADDKAHAVIITEEALCYLTGYFVSSSINFGDFALVNTGAGDMFLAKLEPDGTVAWAVSTIGTSFDYPRAITLDRSGNCYVSGDFNSGSLTVGPFILDKKSNNDIFLVKWSPSGIPIWAVNAGENNDNSALAVVADTLENVYISGSFKSSPLKFGSITLENSGFVDVYVAKFNSAGVPVWAVAAGGTLEDEARAMAIDKSQDIYVAGSFKSESISFDTTTLINASASTFDLFIAEFTPDGQLFWAKSTGGSADDVPYSVDVDEAYNFYIAGYFGSPTLSFGSNTLTCNGTTDLFVTKSNNIVPSGIYEPSALDFSICPNPASEIVTVSHPENSEIEIFNIQGQVLKSVFAISEKTVLEIGNLDNGIYFIKVNTDEGYAVKKLIIH